jgi:glycosyltransferase involved in cell wall biosynthesis
MIDVLYVTSGLGRGGAEAMLVQLTAGLRARGLSQHVVSLNHLTDRADELRAAGVDLTVVGTKSPFSLPAGMVTLLRATNRLRPRVIQGWMYHGNLAASLAHNLCAGRRDSKLFWSLRASNMDAHRYGGIIRLSGWLSHLPDLVIANSETGMEFHRQHGFFPRHFMVIDNGIDTGKFRPDPAARQRLRRELGFAEQAVVVIHVARVDAMKDHSTFLAAMAALPSLTGLMVGDGTTALAAPANVRALGRRRDTEALFAAADIVASTSAFGEGFSNVIAEGMSAGLVPVATDVGDAFRIVGDTGEIVPPGDPQAFATGLGRIAALPTEERRRRGLAARERIIANFVLERAVDAFARLYMKA